MDALVAHYHEIGLKGRNRDFFEETLERNLKQALSGTGYRRVKRGFGRVFITFYPEAKVQEAAERAARVFGVAYIGTGVRVPADLEPIRRAALDMMLAEPFDSFAVRARRTYSSLAAKSQQINEEIGQIVREATGAKVDLTNPEVTLTIELFGKEGVIYRRKVRGPGGLPSGVSGKMLALLSGGIDSPVAAWRMGRRGADVEYIHFHGQPFTDPSSTRQAGELAEVLTRYQLNTKLHLTPLAEAQREIVTHAPAPLRVVLYRRTMMRIAAALADEIGAKALVTGDSLGQVASQTIENINTISAAIQDTQVLRPLVGMDKQEIITEAQDIGTFDISTRKHQDCCVLFEPRSPATRSTPEEAARAESDLDLDAIVGKALAGIETRDLRYPLG